MMQTKNKIKKKKNRAHAGLLFDPTGPNNPYKLSINQLLPCTGCITLRWSLCSWKTYLHTPTHPNARAQLSIMTYVLQQNHLEGKKRYQIQHGVNGKMLVREQWVILLEVSSTSTSMRKGRNLSGMERSSKGEDRGFRTTNQYT